MASKPPIKMTVDQAIAAMREQATEVQDPEAVAMRIVADIMNAASVDDVLADNNLLSTEDMEDRSFTITDISYNHSGYEDDKIGVYAVVTCADENGERIMFTTGSANILAQTVRLQALKALDTPVTVSSTTSAGGYKVYRLVKADNAF